MLDLKKLISSPTSFYCFSPEVMLITGLIEFGLFVWLLIKRNRNRALSLIIIILFCLAWFQFVEYYSCIWAVDTSAIMSGMVAITLLPALGFDLVGRIAGGVGGVRLGYWIAGSVSLGFIGFPQLFENAVCSGNYLIINVDEGIGHIFGGYYLLYLVWALIEGIKYSNRSIESNRRISMMWLMFGYVSFMLPMAIVYSVNPELVMAIPSVMCGFAIILALILGFKVAPALTKFSD